MFKYFILKKELGLGDIFSEKKEEEKKHIKEIILSIAKSDKNLREKLASSNFFYYNIFDTEKNKDTFFKYQITMKGYEYFYNIISDRKDIKIDFSQTVNFLSTIQDRFKEIKNKRKIFEEKKGENWTEYHLYQMSIEKLEKQIKEKKLEIEDLEKQKKEQNNDYKNKSEKIDIEKENLSFYKILIGKNASFLLPVSSEKIGKAIYEGNSHNVCKICKHTCHTNCDEIMKNFCKCFKFTISGFKCQVCPNKCYSGSHEVVSYHYPKYDYKTINDILQPYFIKEKKKMSHKRKIDYIMKIKEEEKQNANEIKEKKIKALDEMIEENNKKIKEYSDLIESKRDKKNNIYNNNEKIIKEEIREYNTFIKLTYKNMKFYEKLFIETLTESFKIGDIGKSSGGRICC